MTPALPPGPRLPALLQTFAWGLRPLAFSEWSARRWGVPYTTRMVVGGSAVQFADPDSLREIFALPARDFSAAAAARDILEPFVGEHSLLMLDGDRHQTERRIVVRSFHADTFAAQERTIARCTTAAMDRWPLDRPFAIHPAMQALTLEVILQAAFGLAAGSEVDALLVPLQEFLRVAGSIPMLFPPFRERWFMRAQWHRFRELRAAIDCALIELIRARRAAPDHGHDVLSALASARDDQGELLAEAVVRDHLLTLLLAGHDTTATALAWAFDLLAHHPEVADRLAGDVERGEDAYLAAVVKEVLRIRPVIPEVARTLARPATIGGRRLPAGTVVVANIHLAHQRARSYDEPSVFRPERFLALTDEPFAWLPFGGGVRRCIGVAFATLEMRTVLRTVVPALAIRPARRQLEPPRRRAVTLIPRHGAPVLVTRRCGTG